MNTTPPLNSKELGTPSFRSADDSVFQCRVRLRPVSSAAFNRLSARSSYSIASQSSKHITWPASACSYNFLYRPTADMAPFTTSNFRLDPAISSKVLNFSNVVSTPYDLPIPGGPLTIMALTFFVATASVISFSISNLDCILFMASSSVSSLVDKPSGSSLLISSLNLTNVCSFTMVISEMFSTFIRTFSSPS